MQSVEEIRLAVRHGADALGFVGPMPSGIGPLELETVRDLIAHTPPAVASVLLTQHMEAGAILADAAFTGANTVQIVDHIDPGQYAALRANRSLRFLQVVHVEDEASVALARDYARFAHALLLDSGRPSLPVPELGGTGRTHDWSLSARIVAAVDVPVFLAGGLDAGNVAAAVRHVRPYGVDLCSRIRTMGELDEAKLGAFVKALETAQ